MNKIHQKTSGFTLVELLIAVAILGYTLVGLIQVFMKGGALTELARDKTGVMSVLQDKMEEIRNETFSDVPINYISGGTPGNAFDLTPLEGKGVIYLSQPFGDPDLIEIKIVGCWEGARVIGEDLDLDGTLDGGEDTDGDGQISSMATIISYRATR